MKGEGRLTALAKLMPEVAEMQALRISIFWTGEDQALRILRLKFSMLETLKNRTKEEQAWRILVARKANQKRRLASKILGLFVFQLKRTQREEHSVLRGAPGPSVKNPTSTFQQEPA